MSPFVRSRIERDSLSAFKKNFIPKDISESEKNIVSDFIDDLVSELGPIVESYPSWHPLVLTDDFSKRSFPRNCSNPGYKGLDHTVYFAHGFVTCPYPREADMVIPSIENIKKCPLARISAEKFEVPLYNQFSETIVVKCNWKIDLDDNFFVPRRYALALMMGREIPNAIYSEVGESWEFMARYFLGYPHGKASSFFVSDDTVRAMKKLWNVFNKFKVFGPLYSGPVY